MNVVLTYRGGHGNRRSRGSPGRCRAQSGKRRRRAGGWARAEVGSAFLSLLHLLQDANRWGHDHRPGNDRYGPASRGVLPKREKCCETPVNRILCGKGKWPQTISTAALWSCRRTQR